MEVFLVITFLFCVGSMLGWVIELIFRRILHKKWINPGFLVGPCLPLYGTGLVMLYAICRIDYSFISSVVWRDLFVIVVITAVMTLVEYIAGLIFIKGMKVKLWDYSDRKGNIQGIICPLFTFFWGVIGTAYYFFIDGKINEMVQWFTQNLAYSFVIGVFFGIFLIDNVYSFNLVNKIRKFATDKNMVVRYEALKLSIREKANELKQRVHYVFPFKSANEFEEELKAYFDKEAKLLNKIKQLKDKRVQNKNAKKGE